MSFVGTCSVAYDSYLHTQKIELKNARLSSTPKDDFKWDELKNAFIPMSAEPVMQSANDFTTHNDKPGNQSIDSNEYQLNKFGFVKPTSNNDNILKNSIKSDDDEDDDLYKKYMQVLDGELDEHFKPYPTLLTSNQEDSGSSKRE